MKRILGALLLLACINKASLESLQACVDCDDNNVPNSGNDIMGSVFPIESNNNQFKRESDQIPSTDFPTLKPVSEVEEFEEDESIRTITTTTESMTLQDPEEGKYSGKFHQSNKRRRVKTKKVKSDPKPEPQPTEPAPQLAEPAPLPTESTTNLEGINNKGMEELIRDGHVVLTTGPGNAPELIEDAPMKHGSLDALRIYEAENPKQKEQTPTAKPPSHPLFMKYQEHDTPKTGSSQESSYEEYYDTGESEDSSDPDAEVEPKCFFFTDIYKGAGKMATGLWKEDRLQDKFGVVGRTIKNAAKSVAACAHSVWKGVHRFVGSMYKSGDKENSSRATHREEIPIGKKREVANDKVNKKIVIDAAPSEKGVWGMTKRFAEEAGDKISGWFKKSSISPDEK